MTDDPTDYDDDLGSPDIAIIGMAGRFPDAPDLDAFWAALSEGRECISRFTDEELEEAGEIEEKTVRRNDRKIKTKVETRSPEVVELMDQGYHEKEAEEVLKSRALKASLEKELKTTKKRRHMKDLKIKIERIERKQQKLDVQVKERQEKVRVARAKQEKVKARLLKEKSKNSSPAKRDNDGANARKVRTSGTKAARDSVLKARNQRQLKTKKEQDKIKQEKTRGSLKQDLNDLKKQLSSAASEEEADAIQEKINRIDSELQGLRARNREL